MFRIDWTVNLGNLIPIASFLILIIWRMSRMETKVDLMWRTFEKEMTFSGRRNYFKRVSE